MSGMLPEKCASVNQALSVASAYCRMVHHFYDVRRDTENAEHWHDLAQRLDTHHVLRNMGIFVAPKPPHGWCDNCHRLPAGSVGGLCDECRPLQFESLLSKNTPEGNDLP
jgi:hypothetical protein